MTGVAEVITDFTAADVPDQTGKTFFVTGVNTGTANAARVAGPWNPQT